MAQASGTSVSVATSSRTGGPAGLLSQLPVDRLRHEAAELGLAVSELVASRIGDAVDQVTGVLEDVAEGGPLPRPRLGMEQLSQPITAGANAVGGTTMQIVDTARHAAGGATHAVGTVVGKGAGGVRQAAGGVGHAVTKPFHRERARGKGAKLKVTNIVEHIDVPVPRQVAYEQWTRFEDFPSFMKKVENVSQEEDETVTWQAQVFWSHRTWKASIQDQVPPERIVWSSEGEKGHVDGAVTFHELTPDLTRVLVTLEYHPKGLFEHTGNLWRAQGRRVRLELKHYRRHVATQTLLHQDEVDGWTGEIHDSDVESRTSEGESDATSGAERGSRSGKRGTRASSNKKAPAAKKKTAAAKKSTRKGSTTAPVRQRSTARSGN